MLFGKNFKTNLEELIYLYNNKINQIVDLLNGYVQVQNFKDKVGELLKELEEILNYLKNLGLDNYYTKEELDKKLKEIRDIINNLTSNYYTKEELDNIIKQLNNLDLSNYFTKSEIREILKPKDIKVLPYYKQLTIFSNNCTVQNGFMSLNLEFSLNGMYLEKGKDCPIARLPYLNKNCEPLTFVGVGESSILNVINAGYIDNYGVIHVCPTEDFYFFYLSGTIPLQYNNTYSYIENPSYNTPPLDFWDTWE